MWERLKDVFAEAFQRLGAVLAADLPGIVAMIVVIVTAIFVAFAVSRGLHWALSRVGFDARARQWGMTTGVSGEPHRQPTALIARGAFWVVIALGIALALAVLGAGTTSTLGMSLLAFVPRLVVGVVVLLVGVGVARLLERNVLIGAVNQGIRQARLVSLSVKWIILVLAAAMSLQHVEIGGSLPTIAFAIVVGGIVLAAALAVGLGARDVVGRSLDRGAATPRPAAPEEQEEPIQHL